MLVCIRTELSVLVPSLRQLRSKDIFETDETCHNILREVADNSIKTMSGIVEVGTRYSDALSQIIKNIQIRTFS